MADFVLLHPAWLGGWCWKKLVPLLAGHGHSVHTGSALLLLEGFSRCRPEPG